MMPPEDSLRIKVMTPSGQLELISAAEFRTRFGVEYACHLSFEDGLSLAEEDEVREDPEPAEWQRLALQCYFGQVTILKNLRLSDCTLKRWLYADKIRAGHTADLYLGPVSAVNGLGVFAATPIEPGVMLGEYTGIVKRRVPEDSENLYTFNYAQRGINLDAQPRGNYTRYINHGKLRANAHYAYIVVDKVLHIILVATKPIAAGEQVLFNYGDSYWKPERDEPIEL